MSANDGFSESQENARQSDRSSGAAVCVVTHGTARHDTVFISVYDLMILSSALAQFIANAGRRIRGSPERAEVMRAREMMDWVDDELYALSLAATLHNSVTQ